jgi:hypothetical protein
MFPGWHVRVYVNTSIALLPANQSRSASSRTLLKRKKKTKKKGSKLSDGDIAGGGAGTYAEVLLQLASIGTHVEIMHATFETSSSSSSSSSLSSSLSSSSIENVPFFPLWSLIVADDSTVHRYLIREPRSRLSLREADAVSEWMSTDFAVHTMRDHPNAEHGLNYGLWGGVGAAPRASSTDTDSSQPSPWLSSPASAGSTTSMQTLMQEWLVATAELKVPASASSPAYVNASIARGIVSHLSTAMSSSTPSAFLTHALEHRTVAYAHDWFLREAVWPRLNLKRKRGQGGSNFNYLAHDSYHCKQYKNTMRFSTQRGANFYFIGQQFSVFRRDRMWIDDPLQTRVNVHYRYLLGDKKKKKKKKKNRKKKKNNTVETLDDAADTASSRVYLLRDVECPRFCRGDNWEWLYG